MDLSRSTKCWIRKKEVALTPEERVRQLLLHKMILHLQFPKSLISVEKSIGFRRIDILCYQEDMKPLLLIECKAEELKEKALQQALGYLEEIRAPFFALASETKLRMFWFQKQKRQEISFLPTYQELCDVASRL